MKKKGLLQYLQVFLGGMLVVPSMIFFSSTGKEPAMLLTVKALSLPMAKTMADAAEAKATEHGVKIAIAIMDDHGNLKYYRRMDGNNFVSVRMAPLKALTSASIPLPTKILAKRNERDPNGAYLGVPEIVLLEGGIPIFTKDGQHIGAIGISGSNPELDGTCAQAGIDAVAAYL
jgi:glc operon protein GlcG